MLIKSVFHHAQSSLQDKKVCDLVIGISLMAVELNDGNIGISYVLREDLAAGCSIFPFGQEVIGKRALEIAEWSVTGGDHLQKSVGIAVLGAASREKDLQDTDGPRRPFGIALKSSDTVGMIGLIAPVVKMMGPQVKKLHIFDKGVSSCGNGSTEVMPVEKQSSLLPTCDIVVLSGTTMINGSIDSLLEMCTGAREIVMIGASTPMFPEAFLDTKVTVLAGSWWKKEYKGEIFKKISLACGISHLTAYAVKKSVRVPLVR